MTQDIVQQTYDNNTEIRKAVNRLSHLLEWLHPEPSPDIFTVRDYRNRYQFTRLGKLATGDIDRYRRVNRAVGNHTQMGLYEFHIGLIYLHEGAFRGGVQQFDQARQQWSFVNHPAAVGLTFLARAVALQQANHFESALASAGKVKSWLERARYADPFPGWPDFQSQVLAYVAELQGVLRKQLGSPPETAAPGAPHRGTPGGASGQSGDEDAAAGGENGSSPSAPSPIMSQETALDEEESEAQTKPEGEVKTGPHTPLPISNMARRDTSTIPVPGHQLYDERYDWYLVEVRPPSEFMPDVHIGDWLLVDLQPGLKGDVHDTEQPILLVMDQDIGGTIRVRPLEPRERFQRIYLVTLAESSPSLREDDAEGIGDESTRSFERDQVTGKVSFSTEINEIGVDLSEILGTVVGIWRPMQEMLPDG